jgi:hypothetical protein
VANDQRTALTDAQRAKGTTQMQLAGMSPARERSPTSRAQILGRLLKLALRITEKTARLLAQHPPSAIRQHRPPWETPLAISLSTPMKTRPKHNWMTVVHTPNPPQISACAGRATIYG